MINVSDVDQFYMNMFVTSYKKGDFENCKTALDKLSVINESILTKTDLLFDKLEGDYAEITFQGNQDRNVIGELYGMYKLIIYDDVPISKESLCHRDIIRRPKNKPLTLSTEKRKLTLTLF